MTFRGKSNPFDVSREEGVNPSTGRQYSVAYPRAHAALTILETVVKIVCDSNAGKEFFIGFSVHNERSIGIHERL